MSGTLPGRKRPLPRKKVTPTARLANRARWNCSDLKRGAIRGVDEPAREGWTFDALPLDYVHAHVNGLPGRKPDYGYRPRFP